MALDVNSYNDYGTSAAAKTDELKDVRQLFVELQPDGQFKLATTPASPNVFGVLRDFAPKGLAPAVRIGSVTYVTAGGPLNIGDYVTNDAKARAVVATAGQVVLGQVIQRSVKENDEATIILLGQAARFVAK